MTPLASWNRLQKHKRQGLEAGYHGLPVTACKVTDMELRREWLASYAEGAANRTYDLAAGTHPDYYCELPRELA